jgi:hypothetical protein
MMLPGMLARATAERVAASVVLPQGAYFTRRRWAISDALSTRNLNTAELALRVIAIAPLVARVRHLNDKKRPDYWRSLHSFIVCIMD